MNFRSLDVQMSTNHGFVPFGCYEMPMDQLPVTYITPDQSTAITAPVFHHSPPLLAFPADERTVYGYLLLMNSS